MAGRIPSLESSFDVNLFNTFRAAGFPSSQPIDLPFHGDDRGRLVDAVRHGGPGSGLCFHHATGGHQG